jgi:L-lysine exporter family protein LysE/ArgO
MTSSAFLQGFATSAALIIAIGAQNAFVLRQGIRREHVGVVVAVCAISDALLIGIGVAGLGALVQREPLLLAIARWGGAAFLLAYGLLAGRRAFSDHRLAAATGGAPLTRRAAVIACLGFTYLNPHCWLDTVVLVGALSAQQPDGLRHVFGAGAASASLVWFAALGYGARLLAPLFERPLAWRLLDGGIAAVMWGLAATLVLRAPG